MDHVHHVTVVVTSGHCVNLCWNTIYEYIKPINSTQPHRNLLYPRYMGSPIKTDFFKCDGIIVNDLCANDTLKLGVCNKLHTVSPHWINTMRLFCEGRDSTTHATLDRSGLQLVKSLTTGRGPDTQQHRSVVMSTFSSGAV